MSWDSQLRAWHESAEKKFRKMLASGDHLSSLPDDPEVLKEALLLASRVLDAFDGIGCPGRIFEGEPEGNQEGRSCPYPDEEDMSWDPRCILCRAKSLVDKRGLFGSVPIYEDVVK
jgi:hypothetical protein